MSPEALATAAAAVLVVGAVLTWLALPLWRGDVPEPPPDPRVLALLAEREAGLNALRDLESDFALGRLGAEEYATQRAEVLARGARVLGALDALGADVAGATAAAVRDLDREVTARLAEREGTPAVPGT